MLKSLTRLFLLGFGFAVLFLGVGQVLVWGADGDLQEVARLFLQEMRRSEALQQRQREQFECMNIKKSVTEDYIAGRITLREAAQQFREADEMVRTSASGLVPPYVTPETEEGFCRQVEIWMEVCLTEQGSSPQAREVRCRFQEEIKEATSIGTQID